MSENPIEVTAPSLVEPDLEGVPEDDAAEPEDAGVEHTATEDEVEG